jgi:hypothetical protein
VRDDEHSNDQLSGRAEGGARAPADADTDRERAHGSNCHVSPICRAQTPFACDVGRIVSLPEPASMEAFAFAFALGAGTVFAARHGRRFMRRAVGWTAETTGSLSAQAAEALAEAKRIARVRYEQGREGNGARTELRAQAPIAPAAGEANGAPSSTAGLSPTETRSP